MAAVPSPRTPRSAKIPQWSIEAVVPTVEALAGLAGPGSNARIAQQLGVSPAGGKFRSKLGTAGYYGFTRKQGEMNYLTPRGEALLGDDAEAALQARREAVMSTSFGSVIRKFVAREPNESTIAARLADDFGSPEASAQEQATILVKAATEARLISNGRFDAAAIEGVPEDLTPDVPETNGTGTKPARVAATREPKQQHETPKPMPEKPKPEVILREEKQIPFAPGVQIVVKVDASGWTPQQVMELVKRLSSTDSEPTAS